MWRAWTRLTPTKTARPAAAVCFALATAPVVASATVWTEASSSQGSLPDMGSDGGKQQPSTAEAAQGQLQDEPSDLELLSQVQVHALQAYLASPAFKERVRLSFQRNAAEELGGAMHIGRVQGALTQLHHEVWDEVMEEVIGQRWWAVALLSRDALTCCFTPAELAEWLLAAHCPPATTKYVNLREYDFCARNMVFSLCIMYSLLQVAKKRSASATWKVQAGSAALLLIVAGIWAVTSLKVHRRWKPTMPPTVAEEIATRQVLLAARARGTMLPPQPAPGATRPRSASAERYIADMSPDQEQGSGTAKASSDGEAAQLEEWIQASAGEAASSRAAAAEAALRRAVAEEELRASLVAPDNAAIDTNPPDQHTSKSKQARSRAGKGVGTENCD